MLLKARQNWSPQILTPLGSDSTILNIAANRTGSASQQTVSSLLNEAIWLLSDERTTEDQSDQERVRSERVAANFR